MFGQELQVTYPKNNVLRASDGKWFIEKSLKFEEAKVNGNTFPLNDNATIEENIKQFKKYKCL